MNNNDKLLKKKVKVDITSRIIILVLAFFAVVALLAMFTFILKTAIPAIAHYGFFQIYFTMDFNPASNEFGIWAPLIITLWTSVLATTVAWWISIRLAFFINFRIKTGKKFAQLIVQLLAGIPSIIFGLFASKALGLVFTKMFGFPLSNSIFTAIVMLSFMIIPMMTSLILNQLKHINSLSLSRAMALGHTKTFSMYRVIKQEIHSGIVVAGIVSFGRAIGETMAVSLILSGGGTNPFCSGFLGLFQQSWATLGADIAYWMGSDASGENLQGALFAVGLSLFVLIMIINIIVMNASRSHLFANEQKYEFIYMRDAKTSDFVNNLMIIKFIIFYPFRMIKYFFRLISNSFKIAIKFLYYGISNFVWKMILPKKTEKVSYSEYYSIVINHKSQKIFDGIRLILEWLCVLFVSAFIVWITLDIFVKGSESFQFDHLFTKQKDTLGNSFMNTLLLIEITIAIALPLSIATAIYLSEFSKKSSRSNKIIKFFLDSLAGTPSILFGMFGLIFFLRTLHLADGNFWKIGSVWAGSFTMVLVILPTFTRSIEQTFIRVPNNLREGAYSLGAGKWETIRKIVIPSAFSGIFTGLILSIGRILSETAPVFLTMGLVSSNNFGPGLPGQTLTSRILYYIIYSPLPPEQAQGVAYEAAMLTFILVLIITLLVTFWEEIRDFIRMLIYQLTWHRKDEKLPIDIDILEFNKAKEVNVYGQRG